MRGKLADVIRIGVAVILGGIGAAAGFTHTHDWALSHGQTGWLAWATAVVIEGMAVVAGFEIHHDRAAGRSFTLPATVLVFGVLVQMTAQVAEAEPTPAGWLVAAMPALGFLAVVKLLMRRTPTHPPTTGTESPAPPVPEPDQPTTPTAVTPALATVPGTVTAVPRVKLPPALADRVTALVAEIRAEGREPTVEDIRRAVKVPGPMAAQILGGLPPADPAAPRPINGHRVELAGADT